MLFVFRDGLFCDKDSEDSQGGGLDQEGKSREHKKESNPSHGEDYGLCSESRRLFHIFNPRL